LATSAQFLQLSEEEDRFIEFEAGDSPLESANFANEGVDAGRVLAHRLAIESVARCQDWKQAERSGCRST